MTTSADILPKYRYFRGHSINKVFIERILLPGLDKQGRFAGASRGILLPDVEGQTPQHLQLDEAAILIIDWLKSHHNLAEEESKKLESIANNLQGSRHAISTLNILLSNKYHEMVSEPEISLTTAVRNNLDAYRAHQKEQDGARYSSSGYNPGAIIDTFNQIHKDVNHLILNGAPKGAIAALLPIDRNSKTPRAIQIAMAQIIASNLDRFTSARDLHLGSSPASTTRQAHSVTQELESIIKSSYQDNSDILNYTGDSNFQSKLLNLVDTTATAYVGAEGKSDRLDPYRQARLAAARALPLVAPGMLELETTLFNTLDNANIGEARALTNTILREIISSAHKSPSTAQLVDTALAKLNYKTDHRQLIIRTLNTREFQFGIAYHAQSLNSSISTHHPDRFDQKLIRGGVNPQHTQLTADELRDNFQAILPPQPLPENNLDLENSVWQEYSQLLHSDNPDQYRLTNLRSWLDSAHTTFRLDDAEVKLASRSRFEHSFTSFASRARHAQHTFYNKLFKIEENLPWNKGIKKALESYDKFVEWAAISVPFTDKKIPLFRMYPWLLDQWDSFVKTRTLSQLAKLNPNTTRYKLLTHFSKGNFTISGMFGSASREVWGKKVAAPMAKWAHKRFQSGVFKYATKSIGRTGTRFLLKVGGKTLAKFGSKAVLALTSAAGVVTSIVGIGMVVGMVIDLVILAKDFVREFLHNVDFRRKILGIGAVVTGALAAFQLAPIGLFLGAVGLLMLQTLLLSGAVALGLLAFFMIFFNVFTKLPWDIDSAPAQLFTKIFCDESDSSTTDPVANCATCLVQYLTECYGTQVSSSDFTTSGVGCLIAQAVAPDVASAIEASVSEYDYLQCIGFARAAVVCGGGTLERRAVAAGYIDDAPPGYTYISGTGGIKPGDLGLIDGDIGHIFVVGNPDNGALVTAIDANNSPVCGSWGCVSAESPIPKSTIAGYLRKN